MRYDWREPGGLLKRAVVNEALRLLRHPRMSVVAEDHPDTGETPVEGMIDSELTQQVKKAIARLPEGTRRKMYTGMFANA